MMLYIENPKEIIRKQLGFIHAKRKYFSSLECKVGRQEIPGVTGKFGLGVQSKAGPKANSLPRESAGHNKHPLPTTKALLCTWTSSDGQHQNQIILFGAKDEKLYRISKNKVLRWWRTRMGRPFSPPQIH